MRCAGGGVAAGSGARDDGTAPSHSSALPSPGAVFAATGAPPALPRPRPRARPSAAASPRRAAGARGPAEVAAAAPPPTPAHHLVDRSNSAPALVRRADRAGTAMQTSLADLVARMVAVLDQQPARCVRVGGLRGSAPALCLARVLERRAGPGAGTSPSAGEAE